MPKVLYTSTSPDELKIYLLTPWKSEPVIRRLSSVFANGEHLKIRQIASD